MTARNRCACPPPGVNSGGFFLIGRDMRILLCGGREYADAKKLYETMDKVHAKKAITLLIHGQANGADKLGREWAKSRGIPLVEFPANWTGDDKAAGPIRNQRMIDLIPPDGVVAFPGGSGTRDMCGRASLRGIKIMRVGWE